MHRVTECKASPDYRLWLRFDDGLEGSVFLGNLLEVSAFSAWRDVDQFCHVAVNQKAATVVWDGGIQFDPDILYQDLLSSRAGREFDQPGLVPGVGCPVPVWTDIVCRSFNS
jgi:hypothetical protein